MIFKTLIFFVIAFCLCETAYSQQAAAPDVTYLNQSVENISKNLAILTRSNYELNESFKGFLKNFSSNQGLQLTEKQQKLLFYFEILNRTESRLATLQKSQMDFSEKQTAFRLRVATITDDLLPESIDRYIALRGTTNAEQLREIRRQALAREKYELTATLGGIENSLQDIGTEIRRIEIFLRAARQKVFPEIEKELSNF